jgi:hypothetical protein
MLPEKRALLGAGDEQRPAVEPMGHVDGRSEEVVYFDELSALVNGHGAGTRPRRGGMQLPHISSSTENSSFSSGAGGLLFESSSDDGSPSSAPLASATLLGGGSEVPPLAPAETIIPDNLPEDIRRDIEENIRAGTMNLNQFHRLLGEVEKPVITDKEVNGALKEFLYKNILDLLSGSFRFLEAEGGRQSPSPVGDTLDVEDLGSVSDDEKEQEQGPTMVRRRKRPPPRCAYGGPFNQMENDVSSEGSLGSGGAASVASSEGSLGSGGASSVASSQGSFGSTGSFGSGMFGPSSAYVKQKMHPGGSVLARQLHRRNATGASSVGSGSYPSVEPAVKPPTPKASTAHRHNDSISSLGSGSFLRVFGLTSSRSKHKGGGAEEEGELCLPQQYPLDAAFKNILRASITRDNLHFHILAALKDKNMVGEAEKLLKCFSNEFFLFFLVNGTGDKVLKELVRYTVDKAPRNKVDFQIIQERFQSVYDTAIDATLGVIGIAPELKEGLRRVAWILVRNVAKQIKEETNFMVALYVVNQVVGPSLMKRGIKLEQEKDPNIGSTKEDDTLRYVLKSRCKKNYKKSDRKFCRLNAGNVGGWHSLGYVASRAWLSSVAIAEDNSDRRTLIESQAANALACVSKFYSDSKLAVFSDYFKWKYTIYLVEFLKRRGVNNDNLRDLISMLHSDDFIKTTYKGLYDYRNFMARIEVGRFFMELEHYLLDFIEDLYRVINASWSRGVPVHAPKPISGLFRALESLFTTNSLLAQSVTQKSLAENVLNVGRNAVFSMEIVKAVNKSSKERKSVLQDNEEIIKCCYEAVERSLLAYECLTKLLSSVKKLFFDLCSKNAELARPQKRRDGKEYYLNAEQRGKRIKAELKADFNDLEKYKEITEMDTSFGLIVSEIKGRVRVITDAILETEGEINVLEEIFAQPGFLIAPASVATISEIEAKFNNVSVHDFLTRNFPEPEPQDVDPPPAASPRRLRKVGSMSDLSSSSGQVEDAGMSPPKGGVLGVLGRVLRRRGGGDSRPVSQTAPPSPGSPVFSIEAGSVGTRAQTAPPSMHGGRGHGGGPDIRIEAGALAIVPEPDSPGSPGSSRSGP